MLNEVATECKKVSLSINKRKAHWMSLNNRGTMKLENERLAQADSFIYLGVLLSISRLREKHPQDKNMSRRIDSRGASFNKVRALLRNPNVPHGNEMKIRPPMYNSGNLLQL